MNSSVKQSQRDGATVEDISAGLSVSVVKNAIYKVIRAGSADELGEHIVVQGGTFLNNAVLRSFELEIGRNVVRPEIAGLMGAFGAALFAMSKSKQESDMLSLGELRAFTHESKAAVCSGCGNRCHLTVNLFCGNERFISGNRCEKGGGSGKSEREELPNLHEFKRGLLMHLPEGEAVRGTVGFPLALGMYELAPFWSAIFRSLGFRVVFSGFSGRKLYQKGQYSIPSDTACYPAKLMHGHIEELVERGVDTVFYPSLTYNFDEKISDNHYNCPVVAYYSELLHSNMDSLRDKIFLYPYLNISDEKELARGLYQYLKTYFTDISKQDVKAAVRCGYEAHKKYMTAIENEGQKAIEFARKNSRRILVLAGRPYNIDMETGHGIDKLAQMLGFAVVSEDSVWKMAKNKPDIRVLNQWTYHSRLYNAAQFVCENDDCQLVQLVYFGCGVDAVTSDETRDILERNDKLYTQLKIDEITNMGAVKIRLRSLIGAIDEKEKQKNKWPKQTTESNNFRRNKKTAKTKIIIEPERRTNRSKKIQPVKSFSLKEK
jgi:predicted nucleotide-binding protein (sugar kinase/HSP70/actin superfamily)